MEDNLHDINTDPPLEEGASTSAATNQTMPAIEAALADQPCPATEPEAAIAFKTAPAPEELLEAEQLLKEPTQNNVEQATQLIEQLETQNSTDISSLLKQVISTLAEIDQLPENWLDSIALPMIKDSLKITLIELQMVYCLRQTPPERQTPLEAAEQITSLADAYNLIEDIPDLNNKQSAIKSLKYQFRDFREKAQEAVKLAQKETELDWPSRHQRLYEDRFLRHLLTYTNYDNLEDQQLVEEWAAIEPANTRGQIGYFLRHRQELIEQTRPHPQDPNQEVVLLSPQEYHDWMDQAATMQHEIMRNPELAHQWLIYTLEYDRVTSSDWTSLLAMAHLSDEQFTSLLDTAIERFSSAWSINQASLDALISAYLDQNQGIPSPEDLSNRINQASSPETIEKITEELDLYQEHIHYVRQLISILETLESKNVIDTPSSKPKLKKHLDTLNTLNI